MRSIKTYIINRRSTFLHSQMHALPFLLMDVASNKPFIRVAIKFFLKANYIRKIVFLLQNGLLRKRRHFPLLHHSSSVVAVVLLSVGFWLTSFCAMVVVFVLQRFVKRLPLLECKWGWKPFANLLIHHSRLQLMRVRFRSKSARVKYDMPLSNALSWPVNVYIKSPYFSFILGYD